MRKSSKALIFVIIVVTIIASILIIKGIYTQKNSNTNNIENIGTIKGTMIKENKTIEVKDINEINAIKKIVLNQEYAEGTRDGTISYIIILENEEYCIESAGKTIRKVGENFEANLKSEDFNKILNILSKY